jgi:hypothetical protein
VKITTTPGARKEFDEALAYYEREAGIGLKFMLSYEEALRRIRDFPEAWTALGKNHRRCLLKRFPYEIVYQIQKHRIVVLGVLNTESKPRKW